MRFVRENVIRGDAFREPSRAGKLHPVMKPLHVNRAQAPEIPVKQGVQQSFAKGARREVRHRQPDYPHLHLAFLHTGVKARLEQVTSGIQ